MSELSTVQDVFVQQLPALRKMAKIGFRHLPSEAKEESITNAIGLSWKSFYALFLKKRWQEPGILNCCMRFAIRQTKAGRQPQGCPRAKDVFDQRRFGSTHFEELDDDQFVSRFTPVFDQVVFRIDVPEFFRCRLNSRQRKLALNLAEGMTTTEAARKYHLSPGRISQFRREFFNLYTAYFAD